MIIDVHAHLGLDHTFDEDFRRADLEAKIAEHAVDVQIVQPGTCHTLDDARAQHDAIAALCRERPGRFLGMANPSPHLPPDAYRAEVRRCVVDLGFVALKLHPLAHGVRPSSRAGRLALEAARAHGIPLMVHTGAGYPFAAPIEMLPLAHEFAEVPIILAHMGQVTYAGEAAAVLAGCPNVYGDTSWSPGYLLADWTRRYGPRLMLGSDHADNTATELAKIRTCGLAPAEQDDILGRTAARLFGLGRPA